MVSGEQDVLWRSRWLIVVSCVLIAGAVALLVATQAHRFVWGLIVWALLVCLVGAVGIEIAARLRLRRDRATAAAEAWKRRRAIYDGLWAFWGVVIGIVAASFNLVLIDIAATVYIVVTFGVVGLLVVKVQKRHHLTVEH